MAWTSGFGAAEAVGANNTRRGFALATGALRQLEQLDRARRDLQGGLSGDGGALGAAHAGGVQPKVRGGRPGVLTASALRPSRSSVLTVKARHANSSLQAG
jgi:hypothetical protein